MTTDTEKIVRHWWHDLGDFKAMSYENQYNCLNMLAGYLKACEDFGHITHAEADKLFKILT